MNALPSMLADEVILPASGLAGDRRRRRIYTPHGYTKEHIYPVPYLPDGQMEIDREQRFPAVTDTLHHREQIPPVILVMMDNG